MAQLNAVRKDADVILRERKRGRERERDKRLVGALCVCFNTSISQ